LMALPPPPPTPITLMLTFELPQGSSRSSIVDFPPRQYVLVEQVKALEQAAQAFECALLLLNSGTIAVDAEFEQPD